MTVALLPEMVELLTFIVPKLLMPPAASVAELPLTVELVSVSVLVWKLEIAAAVDSGIAAYGGIGQPQRAAVVDAAAALTPRLPRNAVLDREPFDGGVRQSRISNGRATPLPSIVTPPPPGPTILTSMASSGVSFRMTKPPDAAVNSISPLRPEVNPMVSLTPLVLASWMAPSSCCHC